MTSSSPVSVQETGRSTTVILRGQFLLLAIRRSLGGVLAPQGSRLTDREWSTVMKIRLRPRSGFTLVEIMIVVAIIGLLAVIAIPNFMKSRETTQVKTCINNLRQIDGVKQQWALENKQTGDAIPDETDLQPYLVRGTSGRMPTCPSSATATNFASSYTINAVTNPPACRIVPATHVLVP